MFSLKNLPDSGISPRQFCRIWFGIESLSLEEILEYETEAGYRRRCIHLLALVTGLKERTVRNWGNDLNFAGMPQCYEMTLAYAVAAARRHPCCQSA